MDFSFLLAGNIRAETKVAEFRSATPFAARGIVNPRFQRYCNQYPYFGFIEVTVERTKFLMFSANDDLVAMRFFWFGASSYEPLSMAIWLRCCEDATVVYDIGAFSGIYALAAAAADNSVEAIHAFEPIRRTYSRLMINIRTNGFAAQISPVTLRMSKRPSNAQTRVSPADGTEIVTLTSLADFAAHSGKYPNLMKINANGAEQMALAAMTDLLRDRKPTLLLEVTPEGAEAVNRQLRAVGYEIMAVVEQARRLEPFAGKCAKATNLLATPQSDRSTRPSV